MAFDDAFAEGVASAELRVELDRVELTSVELEMIVVFESGRVELESVVELATEVVLEEE